MHNIEHSIETINTTDGFRALRREWNELLNASDSNCPFLTWEWLYTWWEMLAEDRKLHIITLRAGNRLVAVAPLAFRPWRWKRLVPFRMVEFLGGGYVGSDYLNLIIRKGFEQRALPVLAAELERTGLMLELSQMDEQATLTQQLVAALTAKGFHAASIPVDICPYIDLRPHDFDSYLKSRGPSHRANYGRRMKNLSRDFSSSFERVKNDAQRREALGKLIDLHLERWRSRGGSNAFHTAGLREFHERFTRLALERNWLRMYVLRTDRRITASLYCLLYGRTFYYYQLGFDTQLSAYSPGLCTVGLSIREAIEEGAEEFDFLRGDEQYKYLWADRQRNLIRLELYPPYLKGRLTRGTMSARQDIVRRARSVIPEARKLAQSLRPSARAR